MHPADVFVGSGLARTDGPHGFVSHGEAGIVRIGAEPGKPSFKLEPEDAVEFPGRAFGEGCLLYTSIMTVEDAIAAERAGCDGIVVSNHGGRALDHTPGTIEVLPAIAAQVKGRMAV